MENRYDKFTTRQALREKLLNTGHKKRLFDFSGNSVKELDSYRATIFELLDELDGARMRLQACEREQASLQRENKRLRASITDCQKNMPPDPALPLNESMDSLPLPARVKSLLSSAGFTALQDLFAFNIYDFLNIHGFGVKALTDVNHALFRKGLPPLSEETPANPYVYTGTQVLHDVDEPVAALKLHPHVEFLLKELGKSTVRSVLLTTANENCKIFDHRARALRYFWDALAIISFPERTVPVGVASEYGNSETLSRSPYYLRLSTYTINVLTAKDVLTVGELLVHSRESLRALTGFTFATIDPIQKKLRKHNLRLRRKGKEFITF